MVYWCGCSNNNFSIKNVLHLVFCFFYLFCLLILFMYSSELKSLCFIMFKMRFQRVINFIIILSSAPSIYAVSSKHSKPQCKHISNPIFVNQVDKNIYNTLYHRKRQITVFPENDRY